MHEQTFRKACEKAGLNGYMVEIANIREQCSWIHKDKEEATEKAVILGRAAIAKVQLNAPLTAGDRLDTQAAQQLLSVYAGKGDLRSEEAESLNDVMASLLKMMARYDL